MKTELHILITTVGGDNAPTVNSPGDVRCDLRLHYNMGQDNTDWPSAPGSASEDLLPMKATPTQQQWHDRHPLIGAHVAPEMKARLDELSRATGASRSDLIVEGLRLLFDAIARGEVRSS